MRIAGGLTATVLGVIWLIMASIAVVFDASELGPSGGAQLQSPDEAPIEAIIGDVTASPIWPYASVALAFATFVLGVMICASQNPIYAQALFVVGVVSVAVTVATTSFNILEAAIPIIVLVAGGMCVLGTRQETHIPGL